MSHFDPRSWSPIARAKTSLMSHLRFGADQDRAWRPYHQLGDSDSRTAFLVLGGLSANGVAANRQLSRTLHRTCTSAHTWSRNLSGHTGRLFDFSGSRFWHWILDGAKSLRALTRQHQMNDIVLIGHSTGGLVVLSLAILFELMPKWFVPGGQQVRIRGVLVFPAFRLKRQSDTIMLSIVGVLYYLVCPLAFLMLALTGPWMWPMAVLAFVLHILLVPQISVPNGEERALQAAMGQRWYELPEKLVLAAACIYFVIAPPILAFSAGVYPGYFSSGAFALFIATLLTPLYLMPKESETSSSRQIARQVKYRWMPIITVANLIILQWLLRPLLRLVRCPLLVVEGELDQVVRVDAQWVDSLGSEDVQNRYLRGYPHSGLSVKQQIDLAEVIVKWCGSAWTPDLRLGTPGKTF